MEDHLYFIELRNTASAGSGNDRYTAPRARRGIVL